MPAATTDLPRARATRYVTALREGGSLPAIVETDAGQLVVAKWRGAGQGATALVAEVIAGQLGRAAGLPIPPLVVLSLDPALARTERDQEIRDLLVASVGTNLGMGYLSGSLAFDPAAAPPSEHPLDGTLAAKIVLFDSFVMNVDRTARNTNLLWWRDGLWLIDHGAALYWHHGWDGTVDRPTRPFPLVREHVLLPYADSITKVASELLASLTDAVLESAIGAVPDEWLPEPDRARRRGAYLEFLRARRDGAAPLVEEAERARTSL
ncbi:MAG: HipA family kinase [Nannocystaceae bacterium]